MYKHLPGQHDQQKHGTYRPQNVVIDAVQSITNPLLKDPHVHEPVNGICSVTFAAPYTTKFGHLSVYNNEVLAEINSDFIVDSAFTDELINYGLLLAKQLGKQQLTIHTSNREVLSALYKHNFVVGRPDIDEQVDADDLGMRSSNRPIFKERFRSQFTKALAKRGVSTEILLQADRIVNKLVDDYNASKVASPINSLNTYGLSRLHRAMVFKRIRFYNPIS